ncbi:hypothetical protein ACFQ4O_02665 [Methylopila musalis]|uniref:Uncharacterized protein n=1 Tax=Methylopila musalis TaxID=1134781 RepID=A0ABW3Z3X7_9HYPH
MSVEAIDFLAPTAVGPTPPGEFRKIRPVDETEQDRALRRVADAVHRLNLAIIKTVESGLSVELTRVSRYHNGSGSWGDQMVPMVRDTPRNGR